MERGCAQSQTAKGCLHRGDCGCERRGGGEDESGDENVVVLNDEEDDQANAQGTLAYRRLTKHRHTDPRKSPALTVIAILGKSSILRRSRLRSAR